MIVKQTSTRCKVGAIFVGSCGANVMKRMIRGLRPKDYPDFKLIGIDTDFELHNEHFCADEDADLALWKDANVLETLPLSEESSRKKGRGTGGDPELAKRIASSAKFQESFKQSIRDLDKVIIMTAVGGGTGSGAAPVVARLAAEEGKCPVALVYIPKPLEGRTKIATEALEEIRSLVPTLSISNFYITEFLKANYADKEAVGRLTEKEHQQIIDDNSVIPIFWMLQTILQKTGRTRNIDEMDYESATMRGNYVGAGLIALSYEEVLKMSAKDIAKVLVKGNFQDPTIFTRAEAICLVSMGPWPATKKDEVETLIKGHLSSSGHKRPEEIPTHPWVDDDLQEDGMLRLGLIVISGNPVDDLKQVMDANAEERNLFREKKFIPKPPTLQPAPAVSEVASSRWSIRSLFKKSNAPFKPRIGAIESISQEG